MGKYNEEVKVFSKEEKEKKNVIGISKYANAKNLVLVLQHLTNT